MPKRIVVLYVNDEMYFKTLEYETATGLNYKAYQMINLITQIK